jgi:hypothetical protein
MDQRDLVPIIRKAFPVKTPEELKKAQDEFVNKAKKTMGRELSEVYHEIYGKSPYLYKFQTS